MSKPRRVKVYLLDGDDWLDHGTGYCVGETEENPKKAYFTVRNELDSDDVILRSCLEGNIQYQRQQETLIVWTDAAGKDLALSFQETEGCAHLCEFIVHAQQEDYSPQISLYYVIPNVESEACDVTELITGPIAYPSAPAVSNLEESLELIIRGSSSQFSRSRIAEHIKTTRYLDALVELMSTIETEWEALRCLEANEHIVHVSLESISRTGQTNSNPEPESTATTIDTTAGSLKKTPNSTATNETTKDMDQEVPMAQSTSSSNAANISADHSANGSMTEDVLLPEKLLAIIAEIARTLILYNEMTIIDDFTATEQSIVGLAGILEYLSDSKAEFRRYLLDDSKQQKVVDLPCPPPQISLLKRDFQLKFLRDVALQGCVDDQSFNIVSSIVYHNQMEIIKFLVESDVFLPKLFASYDVSTLGGEMQRNGIRMLHQYVMITKSLPNHQKIEFYSALVKSGLFSMIKFALEDDDSGIRILGTELILIIIEQDVCLVNAVDRDIDLSDPPSAEFSEPPSGQEDHTRLRLADDMTLILILVKLLLTDRSPGLKSQALEALKMLLDTNISEGDSFNGNDSNQYSISKGRDKGEAVACKMTSGTPSPTYNTTINTANYFSAFYAKAAPDLFRPIAALSNQTEEQVVQTVKADELLFQHLCELVSFCWREHLKSGAADFFLDNSTVDGVARIIGAPVKVTVRIAALRCFKSLVQSNQPPLFQHVLRLKLLDHFFVFFRSVVRKNNLANSTCLLFLDTVHKQCDRRYNAHDRSGYRLMAVYICDEYGGLLEEVPYYDGGKELVKMVRKGTETGFADTSELHTEPTADSDPEDAKDYEYAQRSSPPETVQKNMFEHIESDMRGNADKREREEDEPLQLPPKGRKLSFGELVFVESHPT